MFLFLSNLFNDVRKTASEIIQLQQQNLSPFTLWGNGPYTYDFYFLNVCYASDKLGEDFKINISTMFRQDEIGIYCQTCDMLKYVGCRLYMKINSRKDKEVEVR